MEEIRDEASDEQVETVEQVEDDEATDEGGPLSEPNWLRLLVLEDEVASDDGDRACLCVSTEVRGLDSDWAPIEWNGSQ